MPDSQKCAPPGPADATAAVRVLNQEYIDAARTNGAAWFRQHMAEDVVVVLSSGRRLRKPEFLAMLRDEPKGYRSLTVHDVTLRVFGPTVQVDADAPWELRTGGPYDQSAWWAAVGIEQYRLMPFAQLRAQETEG